MSAPKVSQLLVEVSCGCGVRHKIAPIIWGKIKRMVSVPPGYGIKVTCPTCTDGVLEEIVMAHENEMTEILYDNIERETGDAVLFDFDSTLVWLPRSEISIDDDDKTIELPVWLATKNGLI